MSSRPITQHLITVLRRILPSGAPYVDDDYYRAGPVLPVGQVHGGIDFYYADGALNAVNGGHPNVYAPVTGTLLELSPLDGGMGSVFIKDENGFVHSILHLDTRDDGTLSTLVGKTITSGTFLGTMGGRGTSGPNEFGNHVHYAVYLPNFARSDQSTWNAIDPAVYWTPGVNPNATEGSTGLTVLVTPVNDIDGNGVIGTGTLSGVTASENGAVVKEGESSFLKLGVNTPHTQAIVLRIGFTQPTPNLDIRGVGGVTVNSNNLADYGVAYITLPATQNQGIPNTSGFIELVGLEENDNTNTVSESYSYTVTAGYFDSVGNFFAYGANVFTGTSGSLFVVDNDTPSAPTDIDTPNVWVPIGTNTVDQRNGTDQDDCTGTTGFADPDGDGDKSVNAPTFWTGRTTEGSRASVSSHGPHLRPIGESAIGASMHRGPDLVPIGHDVVIRWNETVKSYRRRNTSISMLPLAA